MKKLITAVFALMFLAMVLTAGTAKAQTSETNDSNKQQKVEKQEKDRPLKITGKTPPSIDTFQKCFRDQRNAELTIRIKVTFHSSGKITGAEIVAPSGCEYFDKESLRVAHKIKFKPQIKDGEAVTAIKTVEYKAGVY
ncbi:MAG TPA: TonB family protein [Pyrinomonadaceae bacterium]|jgi:TonB family protein